MLAIVALMAPAAASAHAYLTKTFPTANGTLDTSPPFVALTFDEAVEPRFAIISVTDANAKQVTTGSVHRSTANPDTLVVPLEPHLPKGWYLVYWRAISVDGHPVQGAFTFAVGPNPGPAPQFIVPRIAQTATSTPLIVARWIALLSVMTAVGLVVFRLVIARPAVRRVPGTSLRPLTWAFAIVSAVGLLAVPAFLEEATAIDSLRSFFDFGALVPLWRTTAFDRGYLDLELCFALFCLTAWVAIWVERPDRKQRSVAELLAGIGVAAAAAAVFVIPGAAGHAAQTSPRGLAVVLDWLHVGSASLWIGGLASLLVLFATLPAAVRLPVLGIVVPRFSALALLSVAVLLGSGVWASVLKLPILSALWTTSYGQTILVKAGLLTAAMILGSVNLLHARPRLAAASAPVEIAAPAARILRGSVTGEAVLLVCAVLAAAVLSSLAPPSKFLGQEGSALAKVGPGAVAAVVHQDGYTLKLLVNPNKAAAPNDFALQVTKNGRPVSGADVTVTFAMLDMQMGTQQFGLKETSPGIYSRSAPALVMVGHWGLNFNVTPKGGLPFSALIVDDAAG
jgi:copper transport protein